MSFYYENFNEESGLLDQLTAKQRKTYDLDWEVVGFTNSTTSNEHS